MQEIQIGDTVSVLSGDRKGDVGKVTSIDRQVRSHYVELRYRILFPDGGCIVYGSVTARDSKGDDKLREGATKASKPLGIEKVPVAEPAKEKAPAKPTENPPTPEPAKK